jgi:leader peptidase (prepilin peptidase)/N-methyltransferase
LLIGGGGDTERACVRTKLSAAPAPHRVWVYAACGASVLGAVGGSALAAPGLSGVLGGGLAIVMIAIAVVDARHFIIPDPLVLAALALGLLDALIAEPEAAAAAMISAALRGLVLALAFWALRKAYIWIRGREGIGLGDVKLAAVAGMWLDWVAITFAVEIAALAALAVIAICALRGQPITGKTPVPFGLFFAPAIWLGWLFETSILHPSL